MSFIPSPRNTIRFIDGPFSLQTFSENRLGSLGEKKPALLLEKGPKRSERSFLRVITDRIFLRIRMRDKWLTSVVFQRIPVSRIPRFCTNFHSPRCFPSIGPRASENNFLGTRDLPVMKEK